MYHERALAIFEQRLGPNHPNTQLVRGNLAFLDTQPQSVEQQIAEVEQRAHAVVEQALAEGSAEDRAAWAAKKEEMAQVAEKDQAEGSPYVALAARLRALAARLRGEGRGITGRDESRPYGLGGGVFGRAVPAAVG